MGWMRSSERKEAATLSSGGLGCWKACPLWRRHTQATARSREARPPSWWAVCQDNSNWKRQLQAAHRICLLLPTALVADDRVLLLGVGVAKCRAHSAARCPLPRGCAMPGCPGFVSLLGFSGLCTWLPPTPLMRGQALQGVSRGLVLPDTFINYRARKINSLLIKFADVAKLGRVLIVQSSEDRMAPQWAWGRSPWARTGAG